MALRLYRRACTGAWHTSHVPRRSRAWRDPPPEEEGSAVEPRASGGRARGEGRGPLSGDVGLPLCPPLSRSVLMFVSPEARLAVHLDLIVVKDLAASCSGLKV